MQQNFKNEVSSELKTYSIKGKHGRKDISFTIRDLIPVPTNYFDTKELEKLIDSSEYEPDLNNQMGKEYKLLYSNPEHMEIYFFRIKDTDVIVIPGNFTIYTTTLKEVDIRRD